MKLPHKSPADSKVYDRGVASSGQPRTAPHGVAPADSKTYDAGLKAKGSPVPSKGGGASPHDMQRKYTIEHARRNRS